MGLLRAGGGGAAAYVLEALDWNGAHRAGTARVVAFIIAVCTIRLDGLQAVVSLSGVECCWCGYGRENCGSHRGTLGVDHENFEAEVVLVGEISEDGKDICLERILVADVVEMLLLKGGGMWLVTCS